jgi:phosphate butyryltransferase
MNEQMSEQTLNQSKPVRTIGDLPEAAREALAVSGREAPRIAVAAAEERAVLAALVQAARQGLARPVLIGDPAAIRAARRAAAGKTGGETEPGEPGMEIQDWEIIEEDKPAAAAVRAVELVRDGGADMVMKGLVPSAVFLRAALRRDMGLNPGSSKSGRGGGPLVSHASVVEAPGYHKLFIISDCALNIAPALAEKAAILRNALELARRLGIPLPKAAVLAGIEQVNPERMPCTADAAILTQMWRRGQLGPSCMVDGPLALDNAVSAEAARTKGIDSPVAGDADILIVPDIEAGNIFYKSLTCLGGAKTAGLILGTRAPVILTSRADSAETKAASIALAVLAWLGA